MHPSHIFISHASKDDPFVKELRLALEGHGLPVWVDSRNLRGGSKLAPEISEAIKTARQIIVVLSPNTVNSPWVRKEIQQALAVEQEKKAEGYRVIPLLLPGIEPSALALWFDEEPVGVRVELKTGALSEALPQILAALGERLPDDSPPVPEAPKRPVAELKLKLKHASLEEVGPGKWRVRATAQLGYAPPADTNPSADSSEFRFTAPLGPIEADELRWYLEDFLIWPHGLAKERAARIEAELPAWGRQLYDAATAAQSAHKLLAEWRQTADADEIERRFSVFVDSRAFDDSSAEEQAAAHEAASALLALPWELMHDEEGFLFQGKNPVRVRRCLPKDHSERAVPARLPIRILLVSPRPEDARASYIDHRISARPLVAALESLGELAELTVLNSPTLPALHAALQKANPPFDVIHFDGHGVYDRQRGLGALCFEDPKDGDKLENRASTLVEADKLGALVKRHRVPLVFLEACQSAAETKPAASVAARLLDEGVVSVVAMTHSVLVETACCFVTAFYRELAAGHRVGTAMLAGQHALYDDDFRMHVPGAGEFRLQDWFVPVLYQEEHDPQLVIRLLPETLQELRTHWRKLSLGELPAPPTHSFVGRSRDLLKLERMLCGAQSYAVIRGRGGEGKTTLAVELARWLVQSRRFARAAFVSLEEYGDARGVLDALGRQLLPGQWKSVAEQGFDEARQYVERALRDHPTIIVVDNVESILPPTKPHEEARREEKDEASAATTANDADTQKTLRELSCDFVGEIFGLCQTLLAASDRTRLVFTSRERLPAPFAQPRCLVELRELDRQDAIDLVMQVLKEAGDEAKHDALGNVPEHVTALVETVGGHARALTLLARAAQGGIRATTANIRDLLAEQERKHPGDRENSLYASVALSLRRLPPTLRAQCQALGVFHGGANLRVMPHVLESDEETARHLALALIEVGLAADMGYGHLRLDPALPLYLLRELSEADVAAARKRWAEAMQELTDFLHNQAFQNAELAARLTLLELPNLLALLVWLPERATLETVIDLALRMERLLANLGRPQALAQATHARERAMQRLDTTAWTRHHFLSESANIDRLLERGQLPAAYQAAQALLVRALSSGAQAYPRADYDIAMAHKHLGDVLRMGGAAKTALPPLAEARRRFEALADAGNTSATRMASVVITIAADCMADLGRLDEAAAAYQEAIEHKEKLNDQRGVAVGKAQLGTVRMLQQRYVEALAAHRAARTSFESLGEPGHVAVAWYQIGMTHREAGQFEEAEQAYRQALAIFVRQRNHAHEASSLNELGNLYDVIERLEDAVKCYQQSAELFAQLQDQRKEGAARNNLAATLIKLQRYDEARRELLRAIECKQPYGHAAEPWTTWDILYELEQATGQPQAAAEARGRARQSYLSYRRDGGESYDWGAKQCAAISQTLADGAQDALAQELTTYLATEEHPRTKALLPHLLAILGGAREAARADDPALFYMDAVELQLLLEGL
jgi:tetratricopeptide (TPR) repeat protein